MDWLDIGTVGTITGFAAAAGSSTMQFVKHFKWWKNSWCRIGSPIVSIIVGILFLASLGYLVWDNGLRANTVALLQVIIATITGGTSMVGLYKPLNAIGMLPSGPDNHKDDQMAVEDKQIAEKTDNTKIDETQQGTPAHGF